jgi:Nitrite/Sulfite reductase ferredoxin-like half domain
MRQQVQGAGRGADLARVAWRLSGELTEDGFKPLRSMNGVYLQLHAYVLRIAIPYGTPSSAQLHTLAGIVRKYDRKYAHFTTRLGRSTSRSPRSAIDRRRQAFGQDARLKNPSPFGAPPHISGCSRLRLRNTSGTWARFFRARKMMPYWIREFKHRDTGRRYRLPAMRARRSKAGAELHDGTRDETRRRQQ